MLLALPCLATFLSAVRLTESDLKTCRDRWDLPPRLSKACAIKNIAVVLYEPASPTAAVCHVTVAFATLQQHGGVTGRRPPKASRSHTPYSRR
ncbi:hypothetical protein F4780DRAFT_558466 [Xylariomycetidae sp. FL0641]|nr:hypothetical protein F4780DRAFT_558466 [Xylariomycetidae sp. FL0641]